MNHVILILVVSLSVTSGQIVFPGEEKGKSEGNVPVLRPAGPPVGPSFSSPNGPSEVKFGEPSLQSKGEILSDEPIDLDALKHPEGPESRFLPGLFGGKGLFGGDGFGKGGGLFAGDGYGKGGGLFGGLANIFNPCSKCHFDDLQFTNFCCQRGEIQCCRYLGGGFGHGGGYGGDLHGGIKPGLGVKPVGPPGYIPGAHGAIGGVGGGIGGIGGLGGGYGGGIGGYGGIKHGYCPKPHLFEGFFGRSALEEEKLGGPGNKVSFRTADEKQNIDGEEGFKRVTRQVYEPQVGFRRVSRQSKEPQVDEPQGDAPQARFLPGLGHQLPGFFCRDECFSDYDCPGHLKCCINFRNCRDCAKPVLY